MKGLAEFIVRRRLSILLVIAVLTLFFGYHAIRVEMYTVFSDLLPKNHPYIDVHNEFRQIFGGANLILLSVEVKEDGPTIAFGPDGLGLIVGNRGVILRTEDGGKNWNRVKVVSQVSDKGISRAQ